VLEIASGNTLASYDGELPSAFDRAERLW